MPELPRLSFVVAASLCSCGGALSFNHFVLTGQGLALWLGLAFYMASNVFWLGVLQASGLGYAVVVCGLLSTIFLTLFSAFSSGGMARTEIIGLVFAVMAIVFFNLPSPGAQS